MQQRGVWADIYEPAKRVMTPAGLGATFVGINLFGITRSPVVWTDEVTLNSAARVLATQGRFASAVFGSTLGFDHAYFWQPPGLGLATSFTYRVFGFGIWQTRLWPLLCAGAVVWLCGVVALRLGVGPLGAAAASSLVAVDPRFTTTARGARMDTPAIAFLLVAFLLVQGKNSIWRTGLGGIAAACAVLTHPLSVVWLPVLATCCLWRRRRHFLAFVVGGLAPTLMWLRWMWPNHELFRDQFIRHGVTRAGASSPFVRPPRNLVHFVQNFGRSPLVPVLAAVVLATALIYWRRGSREAGIVAMAVSFLGVATLTIVDWNAGFYEQYWLPAVYIGACVLASKVTRSKILTATMTATLLIGAFSSLGGRAVIVARNWNSRDYRVVESFVKTNVRSGDVVWGEPAIWYAVERRGATLDLRDSDSPSVLLPQAPRPNVENVIIVRSPSHVRRACFEQLGYRFVARTASPVDPTYTFEAWRRTGRGQERSRSPRLESSKC